MDVRELQVACLEVVDAGLHELEEKRKVIRCLRDGGLTGYVFFCPLVLLSRKSLAGLWIDMRAGFLFLAVSAWASCCFDSRPVRFLSKLTFGGSLSKDAD